MKSLHRNAHFDRDGQAIACAFNLYLILGNSTFQAALNHCKRNTFTGFRTC